MTTPKHNLIKHAFSRSMYKSFLSKGAAAPSRHRDFQFVLLSASCRLWLGGGGMLEVEACFCKWHGRLSQETLYASRMVGFVFALLFKRASWLAGT